VVWRLLERLSKLDSTQQAVAAQLKTAEQTMQAGYVIHEGSLGSR